MSVYSDTRDSGAAGWLLGVVKDNPEGLLLLAAGCALLMRSTGASKSRRSRDARGVGRNDRLQSGSEARDPTVGERSSETARTGEYVSETGETVVETASSYASSVSTMSRVRPVGAAGAVQHAGHDQPGGAGAAIGGGPRWFSLA
jgi:hypothetical protein